LKILEEGGEQMAGKNKYTFESKIHVYRATKRMTQMELADLVGVSRQTIMQLERNRYNPSMLLAYSIAKVFDVSIEDLFEFREEE
jgi:putative transcriptional regulator